MGGLTELENFVEFRVSSSEKQAIYYTVRTKYKTPPGGSETHPPTQREADSQA